MIGAARGPQGRDYQLLSTNTFTTGGTQSYSIPSGTRYLHIQMWGAGGGGGGGRAAGSRPTLYYGGGGGNGGNYGEFFFYGGDGLVLKTGAILMGENPFTGPCNNFDMQSGDIIEFYVGNAGAGGAANGNGVAGQSTRLISHKRNGAVVLDHDAVTGWTQDDEIIPDNYLCDSSYFYSLSVLGGQNGTSPTSIPGGSPQLSIEQIFYPDRRVGLSAGNNGTNNSGNTTTSPGGTGGRAGGTGGAGGTAGAAGANGTAGTFPGGGGGGGGSNATTRGSGGRGATGQVIIRAYG